jgi:glycosyltransferase involved in cell wall biosynthesis
MKYTSVIIIPCYNEYARLSVDSFVDHLKLHPHHVCFFVNDGSKDKTNESLEQIKTQCTNAFVLNMRKNEGKAVAVKNGITEALQHIEADFYGYMDADLATPLAFISTMEKELSANRQLWMVFGSRELADKGSVERKLFRHIAGRFVSGIINWSLGKKYTDTQCGAKLFNREGAVTGFSKPFISSWIFDVEIIKRIQLQSKNGEPTIQEIPVIQWKDVGNSKVSAFYFFKMLREIIRIKKMK